MNKVTDTYKELSNRQTIPLDHINHPAGLPNKTAWQEAQTLPSEMIDTEDDSLKDILIEHRVLPKKNLVLRLIKWRNEESESLIVKRDSFIVRTIVSMFIETKNPRLMAWGLVYAAGMEYGNYQSMSEVAKKLGVTKQTVSKVANECCKTLGIPKSNLMNHKGVDE